MARVCGRPGLVETMVAERSTALRRASVEPIAAVGAAGGKVKPRMAPGKGSV